jgi:hypothetical protein
MPFPALPAALALTVLPLSAPAFDLSGYVLSKQGGPLEAAQVCLKSDAASCVSTDARGAFRISRTLALEPVEPRGKGLSLRYRGGGLIVLSPLAQTARVEWFTPGGRRALSGYTVKLSAGANALALPPGLPRAGIRILRLTAGDRSLAWKAVLASGPAAGAPSPRIASLAKAASATLEISKSGYRTRIYEPAAEVETDAYIYLSAVGDTGLEFDGTYYAKVVALDRAGHSLVTEYADAYCDTVDGSTLVRKTVRDTQAYAIRDGRMWTWEPGSCYGQMFSGTASDPAGKWELIDASAPLPGDLRADCVIDSSGGEGSPFETFGGNYTITDTSITGDIRAETCPGDIFGLLFGLLFAGDTTVTLARNTCLQAGFENGRGEAGTFDFSKRGDSLRIGYAYKSAACSLDLDFGLGRKEPVCPEGGEFEPFYDCVLASGFADVQALAKAAAPMSREGSLPARLRPLPGEGGAGAWGKPVLGGADGREVYISRAWKRAHPDR